MEFEYQGKTYRTPEYDERTADAESEMVYDKFGLMDRMKMPLEDGSILVIGETALKSGVLRFIP